MKNIYLVQFGAEFGEQDSRCAFLPYAVGCLAAYAWSKPEIQKNYTLKDMVFRRGDFSVDALEEPFLVCFSSYVWNHDFNVECAAKVRARFPDCRILFGGHQIVFDASALEALPVADYLLCCEGELPFYCLLRELNGGSLENVPSLIYRDGEKIRCNPVRSLPPEEMVSPYLSGVFDKLLEKDLEYIATIETVRGCPFACAYCDTALHDRSVKLLPAERTRREIDWIADHGIAMCFCIDSNFGMYARDVETARYMAEKKKQTGFPQKLDVALSKAKNASAIRTVDILHEADLFHIVTLSVQSTHPETLRAVGRRNIDFDAFSESIRQYCAHGIRPFTELILGLPCETYDSFCDGFEKLIAAGQKYYVEVYRCYILPNTALAEPSTLRKYGIETVQTAPILHHISPQNMADISKSARIVVSTAAMPRGDWVRANLFAIVMQACYYMGALRDTADYIHRATGTAYRRFFEDLMLFLLRRDCPTGDVLRRFQALFRAFADGECDLYYANPAFGDLTWFAEEGLFLEIAKDPAAFYRDVLPYLREYLPQDTAGELTAYQELMLVVPEKERESVTLRHDFYTCLRGGCALQTKPVTVTVRQREQFPSLAEYARRIVWYRRKSGGTVCSDENSIITVTE